MQNIFMYVAAGFIWGSTWIVITFQLGAADTLVSVVWRFVLASAMLFMYTFFRKLPLRFSFGDHMYMGLQGFFLFCLNYWLVYRAEEHITSGLVAVFMSAILFFNMLNGALFLRQPVKSRDILGIVLGISGMVLLFKDEVLGFQGGASSSLGMVLALGAAYSASLGNILSFRNQKKGLPVVQTNAYGMMYGALWAFLLCLFLGRSFHVVWTPLYLGALVYLALFGSVLAFGCYLTLIGRIGVTKSAYINLIVPVIALVISTFFEGYLWTPVTFGGVVLILLGNCLMLQRP